MKFFFCVLIMTLCGALGALFLKTGAVRITGIRSVFTTPKIWLGGCFYLAGALMNIALLHQNGIRVNCWTADDRDRAQALADWHVDYITSNIVEGQ